MLVRRMPSPRPLPLLAVIALVLGSSALLAEPAGAASGSVVCQSAAGAAGTLSGVVDTYYPGVGTAPVGSTSIDVGAPSGAATPIAAGDVLLVVQVQDAQIDSSNTLAYGHGGAPANPAAGYTALGASGRYEYVRATGPVSGGTVAVAGAGAGAGL